MKKQGRSILGLDIGTHTIKAVLINRVKQKKAADLVTLEKVMMSQPLPLDTAFDSSLPLKGVLEKFQDFEPRIRIGVSGTDILVRRLNMPTMTQKELQTSIRFEAEKHIPFPIDGCAIDFQILNHAANKKTMNVLLVVAKNEAVFKKISVLQSLDIVPDFVDVDILSLYNAHEAMAEPVEEKAFCLLNIGHQSSIFAIVEDGTPFLVREIPYGAREVTKSLAEIRGVNDYEAEIIKLAAASEHQADIKMAAERGLAAMIEELKHSIGYFENEMSEDIKSVRLSGGGALTFGIEELLSLEFGCQAKIWHNLKKVQPGSGLDASISGLAGCVYDVALGLALRG